MPYIVLCEVSTGLIHYILGKIQDDRHFCKVKQSIDIIFDKIYMIFGVYHKNFLVCPTKWLHLTFYHILSPLCRPLILYFAL